MSPEQLRYSASVLAGTERGRKVLAALLQLLTCGGLGLDASGQGAVLCLLKGAWGAYSGTVLSILREQVNLQTYGDGNEVDRDPDPQNRQP